MRTIEDYKELIKNIPVDEQAVKIKKKNWERIKYPEKDEIEKGIFSNSPEVELSRGQIKKEENIKKKIVMILMWGYPKGGRGNNNKNLLSQLTHLEEVFNDYKGKKLTKKEFDKFKKEIKNIKEIKKNKSEKTIKGLGLSTLSKLLYYFDISVEKQKCEIFDNNIVQSLRKKQFSELSKSQWKSNYGKYFEYNKLMGDISKQIKVRPDQVELFLFYFNLYYKFSDESEVQKN